MKTLCPNHNDTTPSFHNYENGGYCFVCGYTEITNYKPKKIGQIKSQSELQKEFEYIDSLSEKTIRGLNLRVDGEGFYILWPDRSYYKKRLFSGSVRYMGPKGVRSRLFIYTGEKQDTLAIVEGEINAMSLKKSIPGSGITICSPGSVNSLSKYLQDYLRYKKIYVIVDNDAPGLAYGLDLKNKLLELRKNTTLVALEEDFNDLLVKYGSDGVKKAFQKETGLDLY